jgi:hydrogenase expression/formation protein HypC
MCLGIPGRVVEFRTDHPGIARVDVEGVVRDINLALLQDDPAELGDWVLIHVGFALQKMTEAEAQEARSTLMVLGEGEREGEREGEGQGEGDGDDAFAGDGDDPFAGFALDGDGLARTGTAGTGH